MNLLESDGSQFKNQYVFFEDYQQVNLNRIRNELKKYFESVDQNIFLSSWRKNKGYIPDGFKSRTILTVYGQLLIKDEFINIEMSFGIDMSFYLTKNYKLKDIIGLQNI